MSEADTYVQWFRIKNQIFRRFIRPQGCDMCAWERRRYGGTRLRAKKPLSIVDGAVLQQKNDESLSTVIRVTLSSAHKMRFRSHLRGTESQNLNLDDRHLFLLDFGTRTRLALSTVGSTNATICFAAWVTRLWKRASLCMIAASKTHLQIRTESFRDDFGSRNYFKKAYTHKRKHIMTVVRW